ncbi:hypothetical protein AO53_04048 [Mycobacterium tuberculosis M1929]|nr:hypothetical protein AO53_04048 [Mycobacterium tuberculosis M1929]
MNFADQTQNPERGRKHSHALPLARIIHRVVRPKTPRGDGNSKSSTTSAAAACSRSRQTQNPERGRKLEIQHHIRSCGMLPKSSDPKPREGTETFRRQFVDHEFSESSDPKPREGTETHPTRYRWRASFIESSDPKPREGTETHPTRYRWRASFIESSDPKPREGTETHIGDGDAARGHAESSDPKPREGTETRGLWPKGADFACSRQTQNPERGRKLGACHRRRHD